MKKHHQTSSTMCRRIWLTSNFIPSSLDYVEHTQTPIFLHICVFSQTNRQGLYIGLAHKIFGTWHKRASLWMLDLLADPHMHGSNVKNHIEPKILHVWACWRATTRVAGIAETHVNGPSIDPCHTHHRRTSPRLVRSFFSKRGDLFSIFPTFLSEKFESRRRPINRRHFPCGFENRT
jgi:hypothetical protein